MSRAKNIKSTTDGRIEELRHCRFFPHAISFHDGIFQLKSDSKSRNPPRSSENGYDQLLETLNWKQEEVIVFGKHHVLTRYACEYQINQNDSYPEVLNQLKECLEIIVRKYYPNHPGFNSIHGNYYPDGTAYSGYHADNEDNYIDNACTVTITFTSGLVRDFYIKNDIDKSVYKMPLTNGDVFLMESGFQQIYKYSTPKRKVAGGRICLTFRLLK